jgi:hypothetical protein
MIARDPFGPLGTLLGYVIAILGVAMLTYTIRLPRKAEQHTVARTFGYGASRPVRRIAAIVSFLSPQLTLSLGRGNASSCPLRDLAGGLGAGRVGWQAATDPALSDMASVEQ